MQGYDFFKALYKNCEIMAPFLVQRFRPCQRMNLSPGKFQHFRLSLFKCNFVCKFRKAKMTLGEKNNNTSIKFFYFKWLLINTL